MRTTTTLRAAHTACLWLALAGAAAPAAAAGKTPAQLRYEQERAHCLSGQTNQDRATCLREAAAALADARRDSAAADPAQYARNARVRCEKLPDGDRQACLARMQGQGSTSGSVAAGGVLRELVTPEPVPAN